MQLDGVIAMIAADAVSAYPEQAVKRVQALYGKPLPCPAARSLAPGRGRHAGGAAPESASSYPPIFQ